MNNVDQRAVESKTDPVKKEKLIEDYIPFILSCAQKATGRYIDTANDEEFSVALEAFSEAIESFNIEKGTFLSFSNQVIKNRLPDHRRRIRWKIRSLNRYISCLESLLQILNRSDIRSEGLLRLKEFVREMHDQKEVSNLKELLPKLEKEIVGMRNLKIQVRFNAKLEPDEMELYNVGFLKLPKESQADIIKTVSPKPPAGKRPLADRFYRAVLEAPVLMRAFKPKPEAFNQDAVFLNDVKRYIDQSLQQLSDGMDSYIAEHGGNLLRLASEIQFYTAAYRFTKDLMKLGAPMCRPKITEDNTKIQGLWDIATALYLFQENKGDTLVLNDIDFSEGKRVFILTGPNGGGKTTFLKAIGTAQVFFQGGLYVPAEYAEMAPVGNLATHFLKRENKVFGGRSFRRGAKRADRLAWGVILKGYAPYERIGILRIGLRRIYYCLPCH
jgi:RNA polymerase sigma factor (sigma-70 family)